MKPAINNYKNVKLKSETQNLPEITQEKLMKENHQRTTWKLIRKIHVNIIIKTIKASYKYS